MMLLVLIACTPEPPDVAHPGVRAAMDRNGDGTVSADEYRPGPGPAFPKVDKDGDGALEGKEIEALVLATDPDDFDPRAVLHPVKEGRQPHGAHTGPLREVLQFLAEEAVAKGATPPTTDAMEAAADAGMATSPGRFVLDTLRAAGIPLPPGLETAPADPPPASGEAQGPENPLPLIPPGSSGRVASPR